MGTTARISELADVLPKTPFLNCIFSVMAEVTNVSRNGNHDDSNNNSRLLLHKLDGSRDYYDRYYHDDASWLLEESPAYNEFMEEDGQVITASSATTDPYSDRVQLLTFSIPGVKGQFSLLSPSLNWWYQLAILHCFCIAITSLFAMFVFRFIIQKRSKGGASSLSGKLCGYLVIIPAALYIPYWMIHVLELHTNKFFAQCTSFIPTIVVFRTLEAMYNTASSTSRSHGSSDARRRRGDGNTRPRGRDKNEEITAATSAKAKALEYASSSSISSDSLSAGSDDEVSPSSTSSAERTTRAETLEDSQSPMEYSMINYVIYYSSLTYCRWNDKTKSRILITRQQLIKHVISLLVTYNLAAMLYSVLIPYNFEPLTTPNWGSAASPEPLPSVLDQLHDSGQIFNIFNSKNFKLIFDWRHLGNMYILACESDPLQLMTYCSFFP